MKDAKKNLVKCVKGCKDFKDVDDCKGFLGIIFIKLMCELSKIVKGEKFMMKMCFIFLVFAQLLLADINIQKGWQNIGVAQDMNISQFDNSCVDYIWKYDISDSNNPTWKLHISNNMFYTVPSNIGKLDHIASGEGYWIKGTSSCKIKVATTKEAVNDSKLIEDKDLKNKKIELLSRDSAWNLVLWIEFSFNDDYTFSGVYNNNITNQYASNSEIRDSGNIISGTWKIVNSKVYLYTEEEQIILTPVILDIETPIGYEIFNNGNYDKKILTIKNYY